MVLVGAIMRVGRGRGLIPYEMLWGILGLGCQLWGIIISILITGGVHLRHRLVHKQLHAEPMLPAVRRKTVQGSNDHNDMFL